jgi:hypothetical protein
MQREQRARARRVEVSAPALDQLFARRLFLNSGGRLCTPAITQISALPGLTRALVVVEYRCPTPVKKLRIEMHLFDGVSPNWVSLARLTWGSDVREFAFREGAGSWEVSGAPSTGLLAQLRSFLALGIEHIFTGYDHLFSSSAALLGGRFYRWSRLSQLSRYPSVTLIRRARRGAGFVPHREPAIALSIAYVGAENLFLKSTDRRWMIAFTFGLIHGFGFASILREMGLPEQGLVLSLLSFNVGVEVGQMAVVAVVLPIILLLRRQSWQRWAVYAASLAILGWDLLVRGAAAA